jgi:hypothetical protein
MACPQLLPNLGQVQYLRPGSGYSCVFAQIVDYAPSNKSVKVDYNDISFFVAGGKTFPWASQLSPQDIANKLRSQGYTVYYMEIWENPPTLFAGVDEYIYITIYG